MSNHNDCQKHFNFLARTALASIGLKKTDMGPVKASPCNPWGRYIISTVLPAGTVHRWEGAACCAWDAKNKCIEALVRVSPKIDKLMPKRGPAKTITIEQYHQAESDMSGYCLDCGDEAYNVEPDARGYACESCNAHRVFGAQEMLLMGLVK